MKGEPCLLWPCTKQKVDFAGDIFVHCRSDGTKIKFLSANTLHIIDRTMWLLPFVIKTNLDITAQKADVCMETRNAFLEKLLNEHSQPGSEEQLKTLWGKWVDTNYGKELEPEARSSLGMEAKTPEDSEAEEETETSGQGNGVGASGNGGPGAAAPDAT